MSEFLDSRDKKKNVTEKRERGVIEGERDTVEGEREVINFSNRGGEREGEGER